MAQILILFSDVWALILGLMVVRSGSFNEFFMYYSFDDDFFLPLDVQRG